MPTKKKKTDDKPPTESIPDTYRAMFRLSLGKCLTGLTRTLAADFHATALECNAARNAAIRAWQRWHEDHPGYTPPPALTPDGKQKFYKDGRPILQEKLIGPKTIPVRTWCCEHLVTTAFCPFCGKKLTDDNMGGSSRKKTDGKKSGTVPKKTDDKSLEDVIKSPPGMTLDAHMYHTAVQAAPNVAAGIISNCVREVVSWLQTEMPYNHPGKAKYRWQAVMLNEINMASFNALMIPSPSSMLGLGYKGHVRLGAGVNKATAKIIQENADDHAAISFGLFSAQAGRGYTMPAVRLNIGRDKLPAGLRNIVKLLADGTWKLSDSKLVFKDFKPKGRAARLGKHLKRGAWFLHVSYEREAATSHLDPEKRAILTTNKKESKHPFRIALLDNPKVGWDIGFGPMLAAYFQRLDSRRKHMREDSPLSGPGKRGHGRGRFERDVRVVTRKVRNLLMDATKKTCAEIVTFCERHDVGTLVWKEPSLYVRNYLWHSEHNVQQDWTSFEHHLKHQCRKTGIVIMEPEVENKDKKKKGTK